MGLKQKIRKIIKEELSKISEADRIKGEGGNEIRVSNLGYDRRTGVDGVKISVDDSRPVLLDKEEAEKLIQTIKMNLSKK